MTPQAKIKNFGTNSATFPVNFQIGLFYSNTQNVNNLTSGDSVIVSFVPWTALPGVHTTKCTTALTDDQNPNNDAQKDSVIVLTTGLNEIQPKDRFVSFVTPNPTSKLIIVRYSLPKVEQASFELYDIHGRLIKSGPTKKARSLLKRKIFVQVSIS